ncbi:TRAP transporter small permease [Psychromarinibacter halotolerans]|uniref:TRAP transporter small permease protein n=1 Tax=Psychromarinibacter halotolerans TaxID=1775175 RepID=A0ABV7GQR5_9RHOB|nr:TRAP transporter small permease [Psychromarinibacter halotolerans]MDF0596594.1 TRAP transporter small permease [Psychromarinibacter halotolerans]
MKQFIDRILSAFETIAIIAAATALLLIMFSITIDAFGRYFLNSPLQGQYEFTSLYLMVILTFLGMPKIQALGGHIAVPLFQGLISSIPGRPVERIIFLMSAAAFSYITWMTGIEALEKIAHRTTTFGAIQFPTYLSYCWVPVGTALITLRLLFQSVWPPEPHTGPEPDV